jgi:hypothetical protein
LVDQTLLCERLLVGWYRRLAHPRSTHIFVPVLAGFTDVTLTAVQDLLGHGSVILTERYARLVRESVRAAVALL